MQDYARSADKSNMGFCKRGVAAFGRKPNASIPKVCGALPRRRYGGFRRFWGRCLQMMDWQMRTNSSGLSGVNAMRFQKPDFLLTRT